MKPEFDDAKRISIAAAKRIAEEYGYDQVVIFARAVRTANKEHVTTYGKTIEDCNVAALMANHLKRVVGWPESKCQDRPARLKFPKKLIDTAEENAARLIGYFTGSGLLNDKRVTIAKELLGFVDAVRKAAK